MDNNHQTLKILNILKSKTKANKKRKSQNNNNIKKQKNEETHIRLLKTKKILDIFQLITTILLLSLILKTKISFLNIDI
jgi:hypothetical protein